MTNIRTYTEDDLKYLLNIALLNKNGYKISKIARLTHEDICGRVLELYETNFTYSNQVNALSVAMMEFDEESFEKILTTNIVRIGFDDTFGHVVFPFLRKTGILWQTGVIRPAHEHFISNLIRQKIIVATDGQVVKLTEHSKKFMFFLPEREVHELCLLYMNYLVRSHHHHTLYLGSNVPIEDIEMVYNDYRPAYLISAFTSYPTADGLQNYVDDLGKKFPEACVFISGRQALENRVMLPGNVHILPDISTALNNVEDALVRYN